VPENLVRLGSVRDIEIKRNSFVGKLPAKQIGVDPHTIFPVLGEEAAPDLSFVRVEDAFLLLSDHFLKRSLFLLLENGLLFFLSLLEAFLRSF
jgi:hypothetical protein